MRTARIMRHVARGSVSVVVAGMLASWALPTAMAHSYGVETKQSGSSFQLKNVRTGKCLTIAGGVSTDNNVRALQFNCDADLSRRWSFNQ
jgi:hypothetical protein